MKGTIVYSWVTCGLKIKLFVYYVLVGMLVVEHFKIFSCFVIDEKKIQFY